MVNIPTELLRTLIAVVDLRSFTKAAQSLGITQPAVSAQIKRLQYLLGTDLLDKSAPGVSLTSAGEMVVNYARRLLSINDQILDLATPRPSKQILRVGMGGDFAIGPVSRAAAQFRERHADVSFIMRAGSLDAMMRDLREGDLDMLVGLSATGGVRDARHHWIEPLVWVGIPSLQLNPAQPVPIATYGEDCILHRVALGALNEAQFQHTLIYVGPSIFGIASYVTGGTALSVLPRGRARDFPNLVIREDESLPRLPSVNCGIYLREGTGSYLREQFADLVAQTLAPNQDSAGRSAA